MKEIVNKLISLNKTISTMESCTGGAVSNSITNVDGASEAFKFGAVTYSNFSKEVIDKYSVYSMETAQEMSKNISLFTDSNYGVGVTGKLNRVDKNNKFGDDNLVYISIYDKDTDKYYNFTYRALLKTRHENKDKIVEEIVKKLSEILEI